MNNKPTDLAEEYIKLEEYLKNLQNKNTQNIKEKDIKINTMEFLKKEIKSKQNQIQEKINALERIGKNNASENVNTGNMADVLNQDLIFKEGMNIVRNYNMNWYDKFGRDINSYSVLGRNIKINYIGIKKLEIKEEWMIKQKVEPSPEFFDNLKNLQKYGKLSFNNFRKCGNIIFFRVMEDTTFKNIKEKACEIWNISQQTYKLYDESFTNLDLCLNCRVTDIYSNYQVYDKTFKPGEICLYIFEKMKSQTGFFDFHLKATDLKSSGDEQNSENSMGARGDFFQCMEYVKNGEILKGIDNYRAHKYVRKDKIQYAIKMLDNYHIFMVITILFIVFIQLKKLLSIYSLNFKKNVNNYQNSMLQNLEFFNSFLYNNNTYFNVDNQKRLTYNFTDMRDYLYFYTSILDHALNNKSHFVFIGPIRIRFFRLKFITPCPDNFPINPVNIDSPLDNICIKYSHTGDNRNTSGVYVYKFSENLNVTYNLDTKLMNYDSSGTIIELSRLKSILVKISDNLSTQFENIYYICKNYNKYLLQSLRGIEISMTYYNQATNLFMTNFILVERQYNNKPVISIHESIPFKINMYEIEEEQSLFLIDIIRLILLIILFSTIFLRNAQRLLKLRQRGIIQFFTILPQTVFQIKNLLLTISLFFYLDSIFNQISSKSNKSQSHYESSVYFDYYNFAKKQKTSINEEFISLYFIMLYSLKYFQVFELCNLMYVAFKRISQEYILLISINVICFLGLTLLTYYIYGQFIDEYQNFIDALIMNMKIFIFSENLNIALKFFSFFKSISITIFFLIIFLLRYFLMNLFYPILIERYRIESENFISTNEEDSQYEFDLFDKFIMFLIPWRKFHKRKVEVVQTEETKVV